MGSVKVKSPDRGSMSVTSSGDPLTSSSWDWLESELRGVVPDKAEIEISYSQGASHFWEAAGTILSMRD